MSLVRRFNALSIGKLQVPDVTNNAGLTIGTVTLVAGTATVLTSAVTANSRILLTNYNYNSSQTIGVPSIGTVVPGVSFVINSLDVTTGNGGIKQAADVSKISWMIVN